MTIPKAHMRCHFPEKEEAFFRGMMQAYCKYNCDCFIDDLWDEIIQDKAQIGAYH